MSVLDAERQDPAWALQAELIAILNAAHARFLAAGVDVPTAGTLLTLAMVNTQAELFAHVIRPEWREAAIADIGTTLRARVARLERGGAALN